MFCNSLRAGAKLARATSISSMKPEISRKFNDTALATIAEVSNLCTQHSVPNFASFLFKTPIASSTSILDGALSYVPQLTTEAFRAPATVKASVSLGELYSSWTKSSFSPNTLSVSQPMFAGIANCHSDAVHSMGDILLAGAAATGLVGFAIAEELGDKTTKQDSAVSSSVDALEQQKNFPSSANEAVVTASLLEHNSPVMALSLFGYNLEITHCSAPAQEDHVNLQGVPPIDLSHYVAG